VGGARAAAISAHAAAREADGPAARAAARAAGHAAAAAHMAARTPPSTLPRPWSRPRARQLLTLPLMSAKGSIGASRSACGRWCFPTGEGHRARLRLMH